MAGVRVELLLVVLLVTGTLQHAASHGWETIDGAQLAHLVERWQRGEPQSLTSTDTYTDTSAVTSTDDIGDFGSEAAFPDDLSDDDLSEDAFHEVDDAATSENLDSSEDHGVQVDGLDVPLTDWASGSDGGFQLEFEDESDVQMEVVAPTPRGWVSSTSSSSSGLDVVCSAAGFQITLLTGTLSNVKVLGSKELSVVDAPESCNYEVNFFENTLTVPFTGCNVKHTDGYSLELQHDDELGQTRVTTASCEESLKRDSGPFPRASGKPKSKCEKPTILAQNCAVTSAEQVTCGHSGISSIECQQLGCCAASSACYYPLDECTGDQHFVFAIRSDSASIPLDPTRLVIPGSPNCKPVIVNDKVAIFKFQVNDCATRAYVVGETKIYLAEVQSIVKALNLKYGIITRQEPLRFFIECRYSKTGTVQQSLASVGYMVKTPSSILPLSVLGNGLYGVQLRIAKDQTYSSYLPINNQPLRLLLGKPLYLELHLMSPKPDAVLLVNYCLAYPRSAKNALVLIYEGCVNPHDRTVAILKVSDHPKNRHQRRFLVQAFQFMDQKTNKYLDEEIYFMCSTEVCRPTEKTCAERCFDGKTE